LGGRGGGREALAGALLLALPTMLYAGGLGDVVDSRRPVLYVIQGYLDIAPASIRPMEQVTVAPPAARVRFSSSRFNATATAAIPGSSPVT